MLYGIQRLTTSLKTSTMVGEAPVRPRVEKWVESPSLFVKPAKKSEKLKSNVPKNTLKVFWVTALITGKRLS